VKQFNICVSIATFSLFLTYGNFHSANYSWTNNNKSSSLNEVFDADIPFTDFKDDIGTKGNSETRMVFKTRTAYSSYFGHNAPAEVDFTKEWVIFYSAGKKDQGGYHASISNISLNNTGKYLKITTKLSGPGKYCDRLKASVKPFVLVKFNPSIPPPDYIQYYHRDSLVDCKQQTNRVQVDTTAGGAEKWHLDSSLRIKNGLGRLDLNFPADVTWDVDIFTNTGKFIINRSVSGKHTYYDLAPGFYNCRLNTVMVENVPIEKGKITKLKTGFLCITEARKWELRNGSGEKFLTSGNKAVKIALPVGNYQLKYNSETHTISILEGMNEWQ
jgi:hypothetical protein